MNDPVRRLQRCDTPRRIVVMLWLRRRRRDQSPCGIVLIFVLQINRASVDEVRALFLGKEIPCIVRVIACSELSFLAGPFDLDRFPRRVERAGCGDAVRIGSNNFRSFSGKLYRQASIART